MPPVLRTIKKPLLKVKKTSNVEEEPGIKDKVVSAQLQKKLDRKATNQKNRPQRGVILVRHLPHGFFEDQLKQYFEQFGLVTRLRLARSRKTGGTKGFAFVEFAIPEVAEVAAGAMDNYLMFKKIVKAHYIPPEEQKFNYFKSKIKKVTTPLGKDIHISGKTKLARYRVKQNNKWNQFNYETRTKNTTKKLNKLKEKYADLGLNFDEIVVAPKLLPTKIKIDENDKDDTANTSLEQSEDNVGSLLLVKKRKVNTSKADSVKIPKLKTSTTKEPDFKQLLDKTIEEQSSSEDEDYIPNNFEIQKLKKNFFKELKNIENDSSENDSNITGSADEKANMETLPHDSNNTKKRKLLLKKKGVLKPQKIDRLDKIIQRTPHLGGIEKRKNKILKSKPVENITVNVFKDKMKSCAAKEILKTAKIKKINLKKKVQK